MPAYDAVSRRSSVQGRHLVKHATPEGTGVNLPQKIRRLSFPKGELSRCFWIPVPGLRWHSDLGVLRRRLHEFERLQHEPRIQHQLIMDSYPCDNNSSYDPPDEDSVSVSNQNVEPQNFQQSEGSTDDNDEPYGGASSREESVVQASSALSNPLVPEQPGYLFDSSGRMRYLGHSSTWSFSQQLLDMTRKSTYLASPESTMNVEASVYNVEATRLPLHPEEFAGLPSLELSLFYLQCVKFRTSPLYYLFDEEDFVSNLHRFYESMATDVQDQRLWYVHFLLILAFGKAFNAQNAVCLAGLEFFNRALRLLPETTFLFRDAVHSTEVLCCIALYLQSIDHRMAAHIYVSCFCCLPAVH